MDLTIVNYGTWIVSSGASRSNERAKTVHQTVRLVGDLQRLQGGSIPRGETS